MVDQKITKYFMKNATRIFCESDAKFSNGPHAPNGGTHFTTSIVLVSEKIPKIFTGNLNLRTHPILESIPWE